MTDRAPADFIAGLPRRYVGSGVLITDEYGRLLMVEPTYKPTWEVPGGVTEEGESAPAAAHRECLEELGIPVRIGRLLVVEHQSLPERGDSIMFIYDGGVIPVGAHLSLPPTELRSFRFIAPDEIDTVAIPRLANRLRAAVRARSGNTVIELDNGIPTDTLSGGPPSQPFG